MAGNYSSNSLLNFLKDAVVAGRLPAAKARSLSHSARALLAHFTPAEIDDLRVLDVEALRMRLAEDPAGAIRPEVAELYIERLERALEDFLPFAEAPDEFEGSRPCDSRPDQPIDIEERPEDRRALESARLRFDRNRADIIPIPLPRGSTVYVQGLPPDLSPAEARKIARVVAALADDGEEES